MPCWKGNTDYVSIYWFSCFHHLQSKTFQQYNFVPSNGWLEAWNVCQLLWSSSQKFAHPCSDLGPKKRCSANTVPGIITWRRMDHVLLPCMLQIIGSNRKTATGLKPEYNLDYTSSVCVHRPTYLFDGTNKYRGSTPHPASENHGSANCFGLKWGLVQMPIPCKEDLLLAKQDKYLSSVRICFIPYPWKQHFFHPVQINLERWSPGFPLWWESAQMGSPDASLTAWIVNLAWSICLLIPWLWLSWKGCAGNVLSHAGGDVQK